MNQKNEIYEKECFEIEYVYQNMLGLALKTS